MSCSIPWPSTASVRPPAASAPRWAAASMPRASPLTIVTPLDARSAARDSATSTPYAVAARAPTMAIARASSGWSAPRTSSSGADGMVASSAGYAGSVGIRCVVRGSMMREGPEYSRGRGSRQCVEDDTLPDRRTPMVATQQRARLGGGLALRELLHHALPRGAGARAIAEVQLTVADPQQRIGGLRRAGCHVQDLLELGLRLTEVVLHVVRLADPVQRVGH